MDTARKGADSDEPPQLSFFVVTRESSMKPLTFENLRRFVVGGRKKKDRNESSFKRSDSFKRISIKKNYLDRGKKHRQQAVEAAVVAATSSDVEPTVTVTRPATGPAKSPVPPIPQGTKMPSVSKSSHVARAMGGTSRHTDGDTLKPPLVKPATLSEGPESMVIGYNQWLKGMRTDDSVSKGRCSGASSPISDDKPPTPPPRKKTGSLSGSVHSSLDIMKLDRSPVAIQRKYHNKNRQAVSPTVNKSRDSLISLSPQVSRSSLSPAPSRTDSGLSINLGRVWIDAPLAMAPRSLELPRPLPTPPGTSKEPARIHHSLDSGLKESGRTSRRYQYSASPMSHYLPNPSVVSRTLSSSTTHTNKSRDSSSKDSGFSFSISIPKLTDFTYISGNTSGFFRKKKLTRPKPSVSRDGYFKRTSGANRVMENKLNSVKRSNSKKKKSKKSSKNSYSKSDIYTVMVNRSSKSLRSLKLDPMIFVPPEKRKPGSSFRKYEVKEIRDYCVPRDVRPAVLEDEDDVLYECISGEFGDSAQPEPETDSEINYTDTDDEGGTFIPLGVSPVPRRKPVRKKKSTRKNVKYLAKPGVLRAQSTLRRSRRNKKSGMSFGYERAKRCMHDVHRGTEEPVL